MNRTLLVALAVTALGGLLQAQGITRVPNTSRLTFERWRGEGTGVTRVEGKVIDITMTPVKKAKVVLRDLETGEIVEESESDDNGNYAFTVDNPSTFVVEMIMVDGHVVALSNAGTALRDRVMETVIQLPGRWDTRINDVVTQETPMAFVGLSSATTMTVATLEMAATNNIPPTSRGEPASP